MNQHNGEAPLAMFTKVSDTKKAHCHWPTNSAGFQEEEDAWL
jgi:hypothetical protein